ncbi:MotA/TolQ/ExbB proton channel family protein [bacterium endosymbiont of Pedicinus badii]|uniref:MotA/TolQ/ExbB proton channel family protein n=1 Tax=bacterium endosymbiont of Pedicinus badii TaxID=1719126 RepID=UPI0009BBBCD2|nr:MotA/TolQ/ExbB proton channel family protein [bacterium endosymbiont of Pedicinus badii]OQM34322.1 hypothetical protein AOQ89_00285 [bacterium endosymbiont of Pedicinus badii]
MNFFNFFINSNFFVQINILILFFCSIYSWSIIIKKIIILVFVKKKIKIFRKKFFSQKKLIFLYEEIRKNKNALNSIDKIFFSGFKDFYYSFKKQNTFDLCKYKKNMQLSAEQEIEIMKEKIDFLATIGTISPYIGLLGTVISIINTFFLLENELNLKEIAPHIAESLIFTAFGLFVSIPAVIGFNYFSIKIETIEKIYSFFIEEFLLAIKRKIKNSN